MAFGFPTSLGRFSIDDQGLIAPRDGQDMPEFLFRWRDRRVVARLVGGAEGYGRLMLSAWLGRVPSSALPVTGDRREASFATLRDLLGVLPPNWQVQLLADHQVRLDTEWPMAWPTGAVDLMAELTGFLLALAPYLDLLDEAAVLEPVAAPAA